MRIISSTKRLQDQSEDLKLKIKSPREAAIKCEMPGTWKFIILE